jgi:hypothetical protein
MHRLVIVVTLAIVFVYLRRTFRHHYLNLPNSEKFSKGFSANLKRMR